MLSLWVQGNWTLHPGSKRFTTLFGKGNQVKITSIKQLDKSPRTNSRWDTLPRMANVKVFIFPKNESILENLVNRRSRPYHEWKEAVMDEVREILGDNVKLRWSQKCGCACGCSPGFTTDVAGTKDIFIDLDCTPLTTLEEPDPDRLAAAQSLFKEEVPV